MRDDALNQDSRELLNTLARHVSARGLSVPAIFLLEMYKPLSSLIGTAALNVPTLFVPLFGTRLARMASELLSSKQSVETLISIIEEQSHGV
ncbi:MAG: hypothetical protein K1X83_10345 [Oligoflexia bacterium]|nr:hypothetical protein [Oligoflexia bacterium]